MTEEEAAVKFCPHPGHRHDERGRPHAYCIGSSCMAWRWKTIPNPNWKPQHGMSFPAPNPYSQEPSGIPSTTHGGCGLAGSVQ